MPRIYLSPPHMGPAERCPSSSTPFDSNWVAPLGPHVDGFEREFATKVEPPPRRGAIERNRGPFTSPSFSWV